MNNTRTLVWYFYKPVMVINLIFTTICVLDLLKIGMWFIVNALIIKLVGYGGTVFYKNYFSDRSFMFYRNAGYSITRMYTYVFICDMAAFILIVALLFPFIQYHANIKG